MTGANAASTADCTVRHRGEIVALLERIRDERVAITVELAEGITVVLSILEVIRNADRIVFDIARDGATNLRLFAAPSLAFATELDRIRIAFATTAPTPIDRADGPAAVVALPDTVVRLQRRSAFRVPLPEQPPVRCTMLDARGHATPGRAMDLSDGGASMTIDDAGALPPIGSEHALVLSLPELGPVALDASLRTVNRSPATGPGEPAKVRLGFRFESLPPTTAKRIRRFVQHLEVTARQAAREGD